MALAPASTVARMLSSVGPPVAIIGTSGKRSLMLRTTCGVLPAADTFKMLTPESMRPCMSSSSLSTVITIGTSIVACRSLIVSFLVGALTTTPIAP